MTKRTPLIAGNWKMNKGTTAEATVLITEVRDKAANVSGVEIAVCPPFTVLHALKSVLGDNSPIALGAQDVYWKSAGAYTGQVSAEMLSDAGVSFVLIGHSERRGRFGVAEPDFTEGVLKYFGETDASVNRKTVAALASDLKPIVCVGETLNERENGDTDGVIRAQVEGALDGIFTAQIAQIVFAYEPVWAIGTGKTCSSDEADRVCGIIRATVSDLYDAETGGAVRILYGGSMKPDNASELLVQPNIDGGLIGGASLKASDFVSIAVAAASLPS
ncbi:MAG: triose-phosphate isomerase [Armatimonadetes bacterium]|nr:triose-phosphate isomerase [Armatimonadota bacterium]